MIQHFDTPEEVTYLRVHLIMSFDESWNKKDDPSTFAKLKDAINQPDPLKSRLTESTKRIDQENQHFERANQRFQDRDKLLFQKIVEAYTNHDAARANVYANELAEVRKMEKVLSQTRLALEEISLHIRTKTDLGDIAVTLLPVINSINEVKTGIESINPQIETEIGDINNILSGIVIDAGTISQININFEAVNEDSSKILKEAQTIAESRINEKFMSHLEQKRRTAGNTPLA